MENLLSRRTLAMSGSGIRRAFELGAKLKDPINLSIGQPDFPVARSVKDAAIHAINADRNGYSLSRGIPELTARIAEKLGNDFGWSFAGGASDIIVTPGTSGALVLAAMATLNAGDEIIIPDPYFVLYPAMASLTDAKAIYCDTYPDCKLTAARVEKCITPRTKMVVLNSPGNPGGVVNTADECRELLELCRRTNILLLSDEIYDEFTYGESRTQQAARPDKDPVMKCPSPARFPGAEENVLLVRGFGKTYGNTGWRLGYAAGPKKLIEQMIKLQQFSFVCAPTPLQWGAIAALDVDSTLQIQEYQKRRDMVMAAIGPVTGLKAPGGAFYAFPKIPEKLGMTGLEFLEAAIARNVILVNGGTFSQRDSHFRLSYAVPEHKLEAGLEVLSGLLSGR
ncbi:MAG: aminotransferase class I/II-fold pyridoxal phosphate-dependent enzyme [Phycisphaeraceae bacterium]|nr:aminotransferase class I/II-fold pyridoxal phosphate-dependent enzyme [Phycisphaeraceae bacterium]